ncbi:hypothetical protein [Listeria rocourtiae]
MLGAAILSILGVIAFRRYRKA